MHCLLDIDQRHEPCCFSCCCYAGKVSLHALPASLACSSASYSHPHPNDLTFPKRPTHLARQSFNPVGSHPTVRPPPRLRQRRFIYTSDTEPRFWGTEEACSRVPAKGTAWGQFTHQNNAGISPPTYHTGQNSEDFDYTTYNDVTILDRSGHSVASKSRWSFSTTQSMESDDTFDGDSDVDTEASDLNEEDGTIMILEALRVSRDMVTLSPTRVEIMRFPRHEPTQEDTQGSRSRSSQYDRRKRWGVIF